MLYSIWILVNILLLLLFYLYLLVVPASKTMLLILGISSASLAVLLFFLNLSMFFIFLTIKKSRSRKIKIALVKFSRRFFRTHIPLAIIGITFIIIHAVTMTLISEKLFVITNIKMITGYLASVFLTLNIISGKVRYNRATGPRRKFHLYTAYIFALFFLIHIAI